MGWLYFIISLFAIISFIRLLYVKKKTKEKYQEFLNYIRFKDQTSLDLKTLKSLYAVNPSKWVIAKDSITKTEYIVYRKFPNKKYLYPSFYLEEDEIRSDDIIITPSFEEYLEYLQLIKNYRDKKKKEKNLKEAQLKEKAENKNLQSILLDAQVDIDNLLKQSKNEINEATIIQKQILDNLAKERS